MKWFFLIFFFIISIRGYSQTYFKSKVETQGAPQYMLSLFYTDKQEKVFSLSMLDLDNHLSETTYQGYFEDKEQLIWLYPTVVTHYVLDAFATNKVEGICIIATQVKEKKTNIIKLKAFEQDLILYEYEAKK